VAVLAAAWKTLIQPVIRFVRRIVHFVDDWFGEPERDGVPERPGVMLRLKLIDDHGQRTDERLDAIEHQLSPNSGSSLHDKVTRIETAVNGDSGEAG
jgi:hypothetical protein